MIGLSDAAASVLTRSHRRYMAIESWRGGQLLAADIPAATAAETTDRSLRIPERVTLTVPRLDRGVSWSPIDASHPLAARGQRLRASLGIEVAAGQVEWFQRGWFLIQDSQVDGDTVSVTAVGLLTLLDEARLVSPYQPAGTLASTLRGLIEPALTVRIDAGLTDRAVPAGINYDEDRLGAVLELLDAWPADSTVTADGYLSIAPPADSTTPVLALSNGAGGTIITATGSSSREGAYTAVVARGTAADGAQVQGVAYAASGGASYLGPFNPLPVPYFYSSPLLTTVAQCRAAAATVLARVQRSAAVEFEVTCVPHPGLQAGDTVQITTDDYTDLLCSVESLTLPYTAGGGEQSLKVRSL